MQVILKKEVQNIGEAGDLVNVKDGYARNFLIPKNYAEVATEGALKNREQNLNKKNYTRKLWRRLNKLKN